MSVASIGRIHPCGRVVVERIVSLPAIRDACGVWEGLLARDRRAGLFQSPQMFFAWQAATGGGEPSLLLATVDGMPVGCVPLVLRTSSRHGLKVRMLAFGNPRADVVAGTDRSAVIAAMGEYLRGGAHEWDVFALDDLCVEGGTAESLARALAGRTRGGAPRPAPCEAYLGVDRTWDDYLRAKGRHFRNRMRPQCEKIGRAGQVSFRRLDGARHADRALDEMLAIGATSWKGAGGTPLQACDEQCFRHLMREGGGEVVYDVLLLELDGRPVAGMLSFRHARRYYLFLTYFDEKLRDYYPGRALMREALRYAFGSDEVDEVSFVGNYAFAMSWADGVRDYHSATFYGGGLRARLAESLQRWNVRRGAGVAAEKRDD